MSICTTCTPTPRMPHSSHHPNHHLNYLHYLHMNMHYMIQTSQPQSRQSLAPSKCKDLLHLHLLAFLLFFPVVLLAHHGLGHRQKKTTPPPKWKNLEAAYDSFNEQEENLWTSKRVMETYTKATCELDFSRMAAEWNQEVTQQVVHTSVRRVKESTLRKKDEDDKRKESIRQAFPPNHQHVRNSWKGVSHFTQAAGDPTPPVLPTLQQQISAAPAVSAQAAAAALEAVAGNSQSCKKCLNHKITIPRKQHNCPYANCNCAKCQGTEKRRLQERNMKKQKRN